MPLCRNLFNGEHRDFSDSLCPPGWAPVVASFGVTVEAETVCPWCLFFWLLVAAVLVRRK